MDLKEIVTYKIEEPESSLHNLDLNPDHTHFILVDDDNIHLKLLKFRVALEKRLQNPILARKSKKQLNPTGVPSEKASNNNNNNNVNQTANSVGQNEDNTNVASNSNQITETKISPAPERIPIVSLLIGGGIGSISLVLAKINQATPVLVFKGTGHAPDLISGAYEDFADRLYDYALC